MYVYAYLYVHIYIYSYIYIYILLYYIKAVSLAQTNFHCTTLSPFHSIRVQPQGGPRRQSAETFNLGAHGQSLAKEQDRRVGIQRMG